MAIWQSDFFIIPTETAFLLSRIKKQQSNEIADHIFWHNKLKKIDIFQEIQILLPQRPFWAKNIILLGEEKSSCIQVIIENNFIVSAVLRLDIRVWDEAQSLLEKILTCLNANNLTLLDISTYTISANFLEIKEIVMKSNLFLRFHNPRKLAINNINTNFKTKISNLYDLSQSRPLLIREKIELSFLEKIQAADSLADLQSIENELNNTATDIELIQKLLKHVQDKQAFYQT